MFVDGDITSGIKLPKSTSTAYSLVSKKPDDIECDF